MPVGGYRINRMIQDMCRTPETMARLRPEPETVFAEYGLNEKEKASLRSCDPLVMVAESNVHPILAFHYLFAAKPEVMEMMSLKGYPDLLRDDA